MRATLADFTAKMKRWSVRITLDDEVALAARGSHFQLLKELLAGPKSTLLMVLATGNHHFNALDQLSRMCAQQRVWSAVLKPSAQGVKQLVVYVPRFSSADRVADEVKRLAQAIQVSVMANVVNCDAVPRFGRNLAPGSDELLHDSLISSRFVDALISAVFMHDLESAGCTMVGEASERQIVLSPNICVSELSTVALPVFQWEFDPYRQLCVIEMTCIPVVMKLKTIAEDTEMDMQDDEALLPSFSSTSSRVRVLPRMSEGWVISRFDNLDVLNSTRSGPNISWIVTKKILIVTSCDTRHDSASGPRTDEEFRSYWLQVHGIHLPVSFGGYVRVRFSSDSVLTYPGCCVTTEWHPNHKQTRVDGLDVLREFASMARQLYGDQSVSCMSPQDHVQKTAVLLPASALLETESSDRGVDQRKSSHVPKLAKRRMLARDRYTTS